MLAEPVEVDDARGVHGMGVSDDCVTATDAFVEGINGLARITVVDDTTALTVALNPLRIATSMSASVHCTPSRLAPTQIIGI